MKLWFELYLIVFVGLAAFGEGRQQWPILDRLGKNKPKFYQSILDLCQNAMMWEEHPTQVSFFNETLYSNKLSQYWSLQQAQVFPACIFLPRSSHHVVSAISLSRRTRCPFAIKSGGHAAFAGASNIGGGITIDLAALNQVTVNKNRNTVSVGAGITWGDLYSYLEQMNLTVVGGRIADIGVGGLTLGGGISFFSNSYGWACDNIASYEVVIATGDVITASSSSNEDLYWALRGGGNNFGVVTKFEMRSYPQKQGLMWVGKIMHPVIRAPNLIHAFVEFGAKGTDPQATMLFSVLYLRKQDQFRCVTELDYAESLPEDTHPSVYESFFNISGSLVATKQTKKITKVIKEHSASSPKGLRQSYWTATFRMDQALVQDILDFWMQEIHLLKKSVTGILPVLTFQLITMPMIERMRNGGGNALGLEHEKGPLMLAVASAMWTDAADDEVIYTTYGAWITKSKARAKELNLDHRYLYMNYASQLQDPIGGYGNENVAKLRRIAKKYDSGETFQKLQPGYFKL